MSVILGFDPSKSTGWAVFNTDKHESQIACGVFELPDKADHYYTGDQISAKVRLLILDVKKKYGKNPDFAVLEEQKYSAFGGKGFNGIVYPWIASSAIVSMLSGFGIPYGTLTDSQWREIYGPHFQPPQIPLMETVKVNGINVRQQVRDKFGKPKFNDDWKAAAVNECERIGIEIPSKKTIAHNACEAAVLVRKWKHPAMKFHARRYYQPWMDLKTGAAGKGERQVA